MTQPELSVLVRDHVSSDEPPFPGPEDLIDRGRRRVRGRRATTGIASVAIMAAVAAVLALLVSEQPGGDRSTGIDPATQRALEDYDARAMPEILDREARAVFSRSVPDLGEDEFEASDGNEAKVPPRHYDKASGMSVTYGADTAHELSVSLEHAGSSAEGDAQEYCDEGIAGGWYLECEVDVRAEGTVISKVSALREFPRDDELWYAVTRDELGTIDPDSLWFQRSVKVIKSETFVTYVEEIVKAPTPEAADALFMVPVVDLVELGVNPVLVMPHPPADPASGCPAWMLPNTRVTCDMSAASPAP